MNLNSSIFFYCRELNISLCTRISYTLRYVLLLVHIITILHRKLKCSYWDKKKTPKYLSRYLVITNNDFVISGIYYLNLTYITESYRKLSLLACITQVLINDNPYWSVLWFFKIVFRSSDCLRWPILYKLAYVVR